MKLKALLCSLLVLSGLASAGTPDLKSMSCMFEIQAEAYRLARLNREVSFGNLADPQLYKVRNQLKASTQELFLNLHEAKPGLTRLGMQVQYQQLDSSISAYVAEGLVPGNDRNLSSLRGKQADLVKLADQIRQAVAQKSNNTSAGGLTLIGTAKISVEKMAHDFEFCGKSCGQVLPADFAAISKNINAMHEALPAQFSQSNYDMARIQLDFLKEAMDGRIKDSTELAPNAMLVTTEHLWTLIDEVLDAYVN